MLLVILFFYDGELIFMGKDNVFISLVNIVNVVKGLMNGIV